MISSNSKRFAFTFSSLMNDLAIGCEECISKEYIIFLTSFLSFLLQIILSILKFPVVSVPVLSKTIFLTLDVIA